MARMARLFVEDAAYHIVTRGSQNSDVFWDEDDFRFYLRLMYHYKVRYGCRFYCYCLMPNHTHIVLDSPNGLKAMSSFMHGLSMTYAIYFVKKYDRAGHVWQNRYKSFVILKDAYMLNALTYVEFNPVRAEIVLKPEDYFWSSYRGRVLGHRDAILDDICLVGTGVRCNLGTGAR